SDPRIGSIAIDHEPFYSELARQRNVEAASQVTDETFDLALSLGPIRLAQPRQEAIVMRGVGEGAGGAVQSGTVVVAFADHRAHVVVQDFARHSAEEVKAPLMTAEQRLQPLVGHELYVSRPAPSQGRDEHRQPVASPADGSEVGLHLVPWFNLEPNQRIRLSRRPQSRKVLLEDAVSA